MSSLNAISKTEVKKLVAESTFNGLLDNTEGVSFDNTQQVDQESTDPMTKLTKVKNGKDEKKDDEALTTRVIDTNRSRIRREVLLICLGDSKGYLHFNHLYL